MGNFQSTLIDRGAFLYFETSDVFNETYIREQYKSSPLRALSERLPDTHAISSFSADAFENFSYLVSQHIGYEEYSKALVAQTPTINRFDDFVSMRSELVNRIGIKTREELEGVV